MGKNLIPQSLHNSSVVESVTIQSNRTMGGIGACFTVLGAVSTVYSIIRYAYPVSVAADLAASSVAGVVGILAFVGFILFLIAMYGFSRDYGEHRIFNFILYGIVITIVVAVIVFVIWLAFFFVSLASVLPSLTSQPSSAEIQSLIMPYIAPLLAVFGFVGLINVVFNVLAFNLLADKSAVPLFRIGGKVLLAGALVTLVLGVVFAAFAATSIMSYDTLLVIAIPGALVQDGAWVLLAMAFFRIKAPTTQTVMSSTMPTTTAQVKYCPNCGAQNQIDANYCGRCGQKL